MLPSGAMSIAPVASLHSGCGVLHIFDADALAKLVMSLPSHGLEFVSGVEYPPLVASHPHLHNGFTIERALAPYALD